jgi:DNA-binding SARP family transcriptional activator
MNTEHHDTEIRFLGPVRITVGDKVCDANDKKAILLLFILAVRGPTSRQQMAALLWPGTDAERAQGSLRLRIHKINRICPGLIQSQLNSITLHPDLRHDLGFLTRDEDIPMSVALEAHRGHLIGSMDFPENPQLNTIISHYKSQVISKSANLLYKQAKACALANNYHQAAYFLNQILLLSPHNEAACRHLMRVHVLSGCRAAAIESYEAFRKSMRESLGIEPDTKTKRLHMDILTLQHDADFQQSMQRDLESSVI